MGVDNLNFFASQQPQLFLVGCSWSLCSERIVIIIIVIKQRQEEMRLSTEMLTWKYALLLDVITVQETHLYKTDRKKQHIRHREIESKYVHLHVFFFPFSPFTSTKPATWKQNGTLNGDTRKRKHQTIFFSPQKITFCTFVYLISS